MALATKYVCINLKTEVDHYNLLFIYKLVKILEHFLSIRLICFKLLKILKFYLISL